MSKVNIPALKKPLNVGKSFKLIDFTHYDDKMVLPDECLYNTPQCNDSEEGYTHNDGDFLANDEYKPPPPLRFIIQMFGINEIGETCCIFIKDYQPFFYVKVSQKWTSYNVTILFEEIRNKLEKYNQKYLISAELVEHNKLYGFSGGKKLKFVKLTFANMMTFNRVKNLWYYQPTTTNGSIRERKLKPFVSQNVILELYESKIPPLLRYFHIYNISPSGWVFIPTKKMVEPVEPTTTCNFEYICNCNELLPQPKKETITPYKICSFDIEASSSHGDFPVPIKTYKRLATNLIDLYIKKSAFTPLKNEALDHFIKRCVLSAFGFGGENIFNEIDTVYPKTPPSSKKELLILIENILQTKLDEENHIFQEETTTTTTATEGNTSILTSERKKKLLTIETLFDKIRENNPATRNTNGIEELGDDFEEEKLGDIIEIENSHEDNIEETKENITTQYQKFIQKPKKISTSAFLTTSLPTKTIKQIITDASLTRDNKIQIINEILVYCLPELEGDKVTFIGSTFMKYGEKEPYMNHCIVLNTCAEVPNAIIETVDTEYELLLKWSELIQRENPDIIIGYNIFGFDYEFMFRRSQETGCERQFLTLSKKQGEISGNFNRSTMEYTLDNTKIVLSTGEYDLKYPKMAGRIQIDLYTYFRRDFNLSSYKLDDVAGEFIGDIITSIEVKTNNSNDLSNYKEKETNNNETPIGVLSQTWLYTDNIMGLHVGDYIHIELSEFTTDYYKEGTKFHVIELRQTTDPTASSPNIIVIDGAEEGLTINKKNIKWCMAKDDVTPQDIFRLTNGTAEDRAIVAKYCIQDCNLVHHLFNKIDIMTGYIEMARICSVPISYLILRGQGIKLTSFVAKKCREKNTLMPDIEKKGTDEGYEGAIVLPPKCDMYMDNPVACVDYSSLYPSSMISQNYSHDSKVWTKEYNLHGGLIRETGEKDHNGNFIYDGLQGYEYIDIEFDTFEWRKKPNSKTAVKTKVGKKLCRWVQLPNGQKSIMPSILEELLKARKETRKLIKTEKDSFMQNILDKRQLGYKVTANSLYGQCGSKTSTFYEQDVAASTTATGRMMITYAKRMIEEVYGDMVYATKTYGEVQCNAEYVYGDSVANYTPIYLRKKGIFDICKIEDLCEKYSDGVWHICTEKGKQEKEYCELYDLETWTEKGWTAIQRIIRHSLPSHKKMFRIKTKRGIVDVTDDHSLLLMDGETTISPENVKEGVTNLLHYPLPNCLENTNETILYNNFINTTGYISKKIKNIKAQLNTETKKEIVIYEKSQIRMAEMCWVAKMENWMYSLDYYNEDEGLTIYKMVISKNPIAANYSLVEGEDKLYRVEKKEQIQYINNVYVYDLTTENHHFSAGIGEIVVHNTDSVFFTFNLKDPINNNEPIIGKKALEITIEIAQDVANLCTQFLKPPMELSYEKTLYPFCLLSKKRYFGKLFEYNPNKGKLKFMGLSLKRRDNCDLLKDVYGKILNILLIDDLNLTKKMEQCIEYLDNCLIELIKGNVSMDKLAITKSLSGYYKNPQQIAHAVLAERIGNREVGNKPKPGDRIKYVHICSKNPKALQGERIETPEYIKNNGLVIDYSFYITNQLMKPLQQLFGLALKEIMTLKSNLHTVNVYNNEIEMLKKECGDDLETYAKKKEKYCSSIVKNIVFEKYLIQIKNQRDGICQIDNYFGKIIR